MNEINTKKLCHTDQKVRRSHHSQKTKYNLANRLNRIEGQIRGIKRLVEEDAYCDDVLNVISSTQAALSGVASLLLEQHLKSCVVEQIKGGELEVIDELLKTTRRLMK